MRRRNSITESKRPNVEGGAICLGKRNSRSRIVPQMLTGQMRRRRIASATIDRRQHGRILRRRRTDRLWRAPARGFRSTPSAAMSSPSSPPFPASRATTPGAVQPAMAVGRRTFARTWTHDYELVCADSITRTWEGAEADVKRGARRARRVLLGILRVLSALRV